MNLNRHGSQSHSYQSVPRPANQLPGQAYPDDNETNSETYNAASPNPSTTNAPSRQFTLDERRSSELNTTEQGSEKADGILRRSKSGNGGVVSRIRVDVVMILLPLPFIVLAILAASVDGHQVSGYGNNIIDALKVGPTIYPIVFAAIVARLMKKIASLKAERATSVGLLEQLMGSQSLAGSVESALALRIMSPLAVLIVLLWALSPLGGQSSLRLLSIEERPIFHASRIYYWGSDTTYAFGGASAAHYDTTPSSIQAIVAASLLAQNSTQLSPVDTWGNAKIPAVESLVQATLSADPQRSSSWLDMDSMPPQEYSSLVGIPMTNIPAVGNANFSIENSFVYTQCKRVKQLLSLSEYCALPAIDDGECTFDSNKALTGSILQNQSSIITTSSGALTSPYKPQRFTLQYAWSGQIITNTTDPSITLYDCSLYSVRVEANVLCTDAKCAVKRIRQSQVDHRPSQINAWNTYAAAKWGLPLGFFSALLGILNTATGTAVEDYGTPIDYFLYGSPMTFVGGGDLDWSPTAAPTDEAFSTRMTRLLNSAWIASQNPQEVSGDITKPVLNATFVDYDMSKNTTATVSNNVLAYQAHYLWIVLLLCVSACLLACAGTSMVLSAFWINGPEILGSVSSLTLDSAFFPQFRGRGTALSGRERARDLKDVRVQLADVQPYAAVGRVALTLAEDDGLEMEEDNADGVQDARKAKRWRIRRGRLYE